MKTAAAGIGTATLGGAGLIASTGGGAATEGTITISDAAVTSDDGSLQYVDLGYWKRIEWTGFNEPVTHFDLTSTLTATYADDTEEIQELYRTEDRVLPDPDEDSENEDYATNFFGSADYTTGPGTSGVLSMGIGDGVHEPDEGDTSDIEAQGADTRWIVVEGTGYQDDGYDEVPDGIVDGDGKFNADEDGSETVTDLELEIEFVFKHEGTAQTGEDGYADNPTLSDTFEIAVNNEPADIDGDGEGDSGAN